MKYQQKLSIVRSTAVVLTGLLFLNTLLTLSKMTCFSLYAQGSEGSSLTSQHTSVLSLAFSLKLLCVGVIASSLDNRCKKEGFGTFLLLL